MNRLLIPLVLVVLVAGCAMPNLFGQQASRPVVADTAQTVVVREIYHETPVVYVDTVYMEASDPAPSEPVYIQNDYNEYNQYNETYVYVHKQVVTPPPHPYGQRWSPRDRGQQPRDRSGYNKPPERQYQPNMPVPQPPMKRTYAPVVNDRQTPPVAPIPSYQPVQPKGQAPARSGVPAASVQHQSPKQAPTPPSDKSAGAQSDAAKVPVRKPAPKVVPPASSAGQQVAASQLAADGR